MSFLLPSHLKEIPPPASHESNHIWTNHSFPLWSSHFNLKNHSQHLQAILRLSFMEAEMAYVRRNMFLADGSVCLGSQWEVCMGSSVFRGHRPFNLARHVMYRPQPFFFREPPISLFLIFLVFFPHSNHHYLDKLLTLPEKLNYINNSTM